MRYADGGGLTPAARARREQLRRQAAALFAQGIPPTQVAARLEVSTKSAYAWRRAYRTGGTPALASKGPSGPPPRLTPDQLRRLQATLDAGPAACGFTEDQRFTLARVATVIARLFHQSYSLKGVSLLLHRLGWTPQMPRHRAVERDEKAITRWRRYQWPAVRVARRLGAWICFADEAGQSLRPAKARTWARKGHTPIVKVTGKGSGRVSIAGLACYKPGHHGRLIYRTIIYKGRKGEKKGFREPDFARLLDAAHQQLDAPIVLIWDNLGGHTSARMRHLVTARPWLRVYQLPAYAPELNPAENVWSHLKRGLANLAPTTITDMARKAKTRLKRMQYIPGLIDAFLTGTGLSPP